MRVRTKLVIITLFVAVVPLVMSASQSIRLQERALDDALLQLHRAAATLGAQVVDEHLAHVTGSLQATVHETVDWKGLDANERASALWLIFGQFQSSAVVTLTQRGAASKRVYLTQPSTSAPGHPVLSAQDLGVFDQVAPPVAADLATGAPLRTQSGQVILPISSSVVEVDGEPSVYVSLGLGLEPLCAALGRAKPAGGAVFLFDAWQRRVCEDGAPAALQPSEESLKQVLGAQEAFYSRQAARGVVKGAIATAAHGFKVVVEQPLDALTLPARQLRWQALFWLVVGVVAAVVSAWVLGRDILLPLERLALAARYIGRGEFRQPLALSQREDEFGDLAESFRKMSHAIAARDAEIQTWNATLQARVQERGRQLEEAQGALLRSQKLAALAVTTAGVAHEMNNPLTGVLGLAQVLVSRIRKQPDRESDLSMLTSIVDESKRMQGLLVKMQRVAFEEGDTKDLRPVPLVKVLDAVLLAERDRITRDQVEITKNYATAAKVLGDPYHLHAVFGEILDNSLKAVSHCAAGIRRSIQLDIVEQEQGWVCVSVLDNGSGIEAEHVERVFEPFFTTKLGGTGQGLGLARVYQLVQRLGGQVTIEAAPQRGARVLVRLPQARHGALLA